MTEDPTMNKLEARQGIDINEFIRPPDTEEKKTLNNIGGALK